MITQRSHWAVCIVCGLTVAVVYLCMTAQTASARPSLEDIVKSPFFSFTDQRDMEVINGTCESLLSMLERELDQGVDAGDIELVKKFLTIERVKEFLTEVAAFTSTETVKGESYFIVNFAQSDDTAMRRLREEVLLPAPPGGAIVRVYLLEEAMPLPIGALLQEQTRGITIGGRFVAVRATNMSPQEREAVISHELVHAYINSYLGPDTKKLPRWFHEGVALYLPAVKNVYLSHTGIDVSPEGYREYRAVFRYLESILGRQGVAKFIRQAVEQQSIDEPLYAAIGTTSYDELRNRALRPRWWPEASKWWPEASKWWPDLPALWSEPMLWGSLVCLALLMLMVARGWKKEEEALTPVERESALAKKGKHRDRARRETIPSEQPRDIILRAYSDYYEQQQHNQVLAETERGVALDPNEARSYEALAWVLSRMGRLEGGLEAAAQALRLKPSIADEHLNILDVYLILAAVYSELGKEAEARAEAAEVLRINPEFSLEVHRQRAPLKDPAMLECHLAALRKAGLK